MSGRQNDLDNLMRELGVDAPRTSDVDQPVDPGRSASGLSAIEAEFESPAENGHASAEMPTMFRRNESTPPPPDMSGKGLGESLEDCANDLESDDDRIRPLDAVKEFWRPTEEPETDTASLPEQLLKDAIVAPDILETAKRVQLQSPGRGLPEILMEMGAN